MGDRKSSSPSRQRAESLIVTRIRREGRASSTPHRRSIEDLRTPTTDLSPETPFAPAPTFTERADVVPPATPFVPARSSFACSRRPFVPPRRSFVTACRYFDPARTGDVCVRADIDRIRADDDYKPCSQRAWRFGQPGRVTLVRARVEPLVGPRLALGSAISSLTTCRTASRTERCSIYATSESLIRV